MALKGLSTGLGRIHQLINVQKLFIEVVNAGGADGVVLVALAVQVFSGRDSRIHDQVSKTSSRGKGPGNSNGPNRVQTICVLYNLSFRRGHFLLRDPIPLKDKSRMIS